MDLQQRNDQLEEKLKDSDLPKAVSVLIRDAKRRKHQLRILAVSIVLDILLTIGLGLISLRTHRLAATAESNKQAIVRSCETSNEARAKNKMLWDYIFNLPSTTPTADQQAQRDKFKAFVAETFAPRDCSIK